MRLYTQVRIVVTITLLWTGLAPAADEPLPSWNQASSKQAIIDFVTKVTNESSEAFVPEGDRIATFDNDGTLWTEKPLYTHFYGVLAQMKAQMEDDPFLDSREPYRSVAKKDFTYFTALYENSAFASLAGQLFAVPFGGFTDEQYDSWFRTFLLEFKHPKLGVGVEGLIYQPMVELIRYLELNGFTVYIFTADEAAFLLRCSAQEVSA